jgi:hypothetical protein
MSTDVSEEGKTGSKQTALFVYCLPAYAGFLLGLLFSPIYGSDMFLRNVG